MENIACKRDDDVLVRGRVVASRLPGAKTSAVLRDAEKRLLRDPSPVYPLEVRTLLLDDGGVTGSKRKVRK
jgi:hypothetical protein